MVKIYALKDSTGVRYIGKTTQPLPFRLRDHINKAIRKDRTKKDKWINSLIDLGDYPEVVLVDVVDDIDGSKFERYWYYHYLSLGCDLVNTATPGAGGTFKRKVDWFKYESLFGKIPDGDLAEIAGVTRKAVSYQRRKRKIKACGVRDEKRVLPPQNGGWNKKELPQDIISQLGTMSDTKLAKIAGVEKSKIQRERVNLGIASWSESNNHPTRYKEGNYPERWL